MRCNNALFVGQHDIADDLRLEFGKPESGWGIKLVTDAKTAITEFKNGEYDIVISELVLADSEAADLFRQVKELEPGTVFFVLTSHDDREKMTRVVSLAHQIIAKPIKADALRMRLTNSMALRGVLTDEKLHARIAQISSLPTLPSLYKQLVEEMQSETASMQRVANLIRQDVTITAKLLQMSNSAFFGLSARVENPLQAANLLGMETVKSLVLAAGVFSQFDQHGMPGFSVETIYNHSLAVGTSAKHFANAFGLGRKQAEEALMAGMLHDIGKLVMLANFREELAQSYALAEKEKISMYEAERRVIGVSHCEIGAHLLSLWGMSDLILEAVTLHDNPALCPCPMVNILASVHIANAIDHDRALVDRDPKFTHANGDYLTKLGLSGQMSYLRSLVPA